MTEEQNPAALIITAAGSSSRMGQGVKKEYLSFGGGGGTILSAAAKVFLQTVRFRLVVITYPAQGLAQKDSGSCLTGDFDKSAQEAAKAALFSDDFVSECARRGETKFVFTQGGQTRRRSVFNALRVCEKEFAESENPFVVIHDGARPFVTSELISKTFAAARIFGAAIPAIEPVDTQVQTDENGFILRHLERSKLACVQTPQIFRLFPLIYAHQKAESDSAAKESMFTDDSAIWDAYVKDEPVKIVKGDAANKKITYPSDLKAQSEIPAASCPKDAEESGSLPEIRAGLGYDKHALVKDRPLMIGGVEIPSELGESGHSDGDVLLHALIDSLAGASAIGDVGSFFPPSDPRWKGADSKDLLKIVWQKISESGWRIENIDCVIALEKPKFLPHRDAVIKSIARALNVSPSRIFAKAKTGEKLGDVGQSRAIEAWVTCLLTRPRR